MDTTTLSLKLVEPKSDRLWIALGIPEDRYTLLLDKVEQSWVNQVANSREYFSSKTIEEVSEFCKTPAELALISHSAAQYLNANPVEAMILAKAQKKTDPAAPHLGKPGLA